VWHRRKGFDIIATGVTDLEITCSGGSSTTVSGWATYTVLPVSVTITAYLTDSNGIFLFLDKGTKATRDGVEDEDVKRVHPFCGSGIKFVHTILVSQE
jgi:hypothetical protein